jgi:predicted RecB family nuclease
MQKIDGVTVLSPSDLSNHLACSHLSYLNFRTLNGGPKPPKVDDELTEILQKYGAEHESRYLEALQRQLAEVGKTVIDLDVQRTAHAAYSAAEIQSRATDVASAFAAGPNALYQPTFFHLEGQVGWIGRADFLVPKETPSNLGDYAFEPYDTKLARIAKVNALIQLCSYAEQIALIQGTPPEEIHIVTGSEKEGTVSVRLSEVSAYFRHVKQAFQDSLADGFESAAEPAPTEHCGICRWGRVCTKTWRENDDITFVAGVTNSYREILRKAGVQSLPDLADKTDTPEDLRPEAFARLKAQANLQLRSREAKRVDAQAKPMYEFIRPLQERRGFNLLPEPAPGDIFYDIEGHPYRGDEGLEYLHGLAWVDNTGELRYKEIWAHDEEGERLALQQVVDFIYERIADPASGDLRVYHFGHYEPSALRRMATRFATYETKLERVVTQALRIGVESYSIKKLEELYEFRRDDLVEEGGLSIIHYEHWINSRDTADFGSKGDNRILDELAKYNRNDCHSTIHLRTWLEQRRAELLSTLNHAENEMLVRPHLNIIADDESIGTGLVAQLNAGRFEPELSEDDAARLGHRWLMADLLDFHKRERSVEVFEFLQMLNKTDMELYDDPNVIAGLDFLSELESTPATGRRNHAVIRRYRFDPNQLTKLDINDQITATNYYSPPSQEGERTPRPSISFDFLDVDRGIVDLRISSSTLPIPDPVAIFESKSINKKGFEDALVELATLVLDGDEQKFPASHDLLRRTPPRLRQLSLDKLNHDGQIDWKSISQIALDLDQSYFVIQGPPGTGKTYSSAKAILQLVRSGQRIGIAANTHNAVEQLLSEITDHAEDFGFNSDEPLTILHKPRDGIDSAFQSTTHAVIVKTKTDNSKVSAEVPNHHIVAGTSFLFTSSAMRQTVDVLFIDEAGQLSLADTLGASLSARNLVLVGDPQQLKQPTKAAHPGHSGLSGLEYINQEADVVPPDYGVLLNVTRRMHPAITSFVSEQVYESKLFSESSCSNQEIGGNDELSGSGLRWIPVEHVGRSTYSPEECDLIVKIYYQMLGRLFTDKQGNSRHITSEDLFVIAPYNHQTHKLRQGLLAHHQAAASGVTDEVVKRRVGTVDKAQGDEAPVVIISHTSSCAEDVPRGMEFHYSKNRFNVAVSRAKALAIVVANPRLLDVTCKTIEQVKLANMLCRYAEVAKAVSL